MYRKNRFLKLKEKTKTTVMPSLYANEGSIKVIKCEFAKALQRDGSITSRCRILSSIEAYVM